MSPHARKPEPLQDRQRQDQQGEPLVKARQVRRRLRTSTTRPLEERLVDMAAARKEIAAALRVHRAAAAVTRRSRDQHEQQQQVQWPPCDAFFSDHLRDDSTPRYLAPVPVAPPVVGGGLLRHLDRSLPALPLGLNLSFHSFTGSYVYEASNSAGRSRDRPLVKPSPADFSNSPERSSPLSAVMPSQGGPPAVDAPENSALPHPVLAGGGDATSFLGAVDLAATPAYAWWSDVLDRGTEDSGCVGKLGAPAGHEGDDVDVAGMPDSGWLYDLPGDQGGKPVGGLGAHLDGGDYYHYCHQRDDEDIALPCMEIEGWDGEWF